MCPCPRILACAEVPTQPVCCSWHLGIPETESQSMRYMYQRQRRRRPMPLALVTGPRHHVESEKCVSSTLRGLPGTQPIRP